MKILVIGGMGIIGGAITEAAALKGYDVYVLSRRKLSEKWSKLGIKGIAGNWLNDSFAEKAVSEGYDVIVDTLVFDETRLMQSAKIVDGHCKHYIYISTDSVYPHPADNLSEDEDINIDEVYWDYGINKLKAERCLYENGGNYRFNWTCIRPTITFGDTRIPVGYSSKRGTYTLADRIINGKPIIRFDNPNTRHAICHASIFGKAVVGLFLNEKSFGQSYHISDDHAYTYDEIFRAIENILGVKGIYVYVSTDKIKKYSKSLYEEMIYDKNPNFTLDNNKIKSIVPNENYHVDIQLVMADILENLKNSHNIDNEYNYITDNLLIEQSREQNNDHVNRQLESYLTSLDDQYLKELLWFKRRRQLSRLLEPLRMVKRFLKKIIKVVAQIK